MHVAPLQAAGAEPQVLVVDDNPVNQQVAVGLLRRLGIASAVAADGLVAIDMLRMQSFALVLMDLQMPGLDGMTATRRIRSGEAGVRDPGIPVLALTANALPEYRQQCLEAGFDDFLTKPIDVKAFAAKLQRWLPNSAEAAPVPATEPSRPGHTASNTVPADQAVLDRAGLLERSMNDPDLAREILEAFVTEACALYASLLRHVRAGNVEQTRGVAHSIKGAAANAGALRVATLAADIEGRARAGDIAGAGPLAEELAAEIDAFRCHARDEFEAEAAGSGATIPEAAR